jgi:hypothetical protein
MVVVRKAELSKCSAFREAAHLIVLEEFSEFIDVVAFGTQQQKLVEG